MAAGTATVPRLRRLDCPVRIIFGAADPYLNAGVARRFHGLFPNSELFLLDGARHYVQLDEPQQVVLTTPSERIAHRSAESLRPPVHLDTRPGPTLELDGSVASPANACKL